MNDYLRLARAFANHQDVFGAGMEILELSNDPDYPILDAAIKVATQRYVAKPLLRSSRYGIFDRARLRYLAQTHETFEAAQKAANFWNGEVGSK